MPTKPDANTFQFRTVKRADDITVLPGGRYLLFRTIEKGADGLYDIIERMYPASPENLEKLRNWTIPARYNNIMKNIREEKAHSRWRQKHDPRYGGK